MRINIIGTRGFPLIQGGVEKHCESLYPLLGKKGCEIKVYRRSPYIHKDNKTSVFPNVTFSDIYALKSKNIETIFHSFLASTLTIFDKPDIVHIHNVGPALLLPLLKLFGLKIIVTFHSENYHHEKWGWLAKNMLILGEKIMLRFADCVIFVSKNQYEKYSCRNKVYIPNGVSFYKTVSSHEYLDQLKLIPGKYILTVGRFTPEKGILDLINAFRRIDCGEYKLVIAGDADHETDYSRKIRKIAAGEENIILTGYITGDRLSQIYSNAGIFVFASHHEGFPIALLEALSFGLPIVASNIPAHLELLREEFTFPVGNVDLLAKKLASCLDNLPCSFKRGELTLNRKNLLEQYNWEK